MSAEEHDRRIEAEEVSRTTKIKKYLLDLAQQRALQIREKEKALQVERLLDK